MTDIVEHVELVPADSRARGSRVDYAVVAFLSRYRNPQTRRGYTISLQQWRQFCAEHGIDMLEARRPEIELFARELELTGRKVSTVAAKPSASGFLAGTVAALPFGAGRSLAGAADPTTGRWDVGVVSVVGMALRAGGLAGVDDIEVAGPHAERHSAEVVDVLVVGDGDASELQGHPVCPLDAALVLDGAVAPASVCGASPEPAGVGLGDLGPEAERGVTVLERPGRRAAGSSPVGVVPVAHAAGLVGAVTAGDGAKALRHAHDSNRVRCSVEQGAT